MANAPKSDLLKILRQEADAVGIERKAQQQASLEVVDAIERRLIDIFHYFEEVCRLLSVITPVVNRIYQMPHVVRYEGMHFERGLVSYRKVKLGHREVHDYVALYYALKGPEIRPLKVEMGRSPDVERALLAANVEYTTASDSAVRGRATHNIITVSPSLRCEVRFDPDFLSNRIAVTLRNVDRFEPITFDFPTDTLSNEALDDLVQLLLGKTSQFLFRAPVRGFVRHQ